MAYNVQTLPNYVEQNRSDLMSAAVLSPKSATLFSLMPNVKGETTINILDVGVVFQNGKACAFNPAGDDNFTQRSIIPGIVKVNKTWCPKDLLNKYLVNEVSIGAGREVLPFEQKTVTELLAKIGAELEKALWQGNKTSGTGNMAFFDGLVTIIAADAASGVIPAGNVITAAAADTVRKRVYDTYEAIPDAALEEAAIMLSYANYRKLALALMEANLFHYERNVESSMEMTLPGTNTRVIGIPGLTGVDTIYGLVPEEVVYGFDAQDDAQTFKLWFSDDDDLFKFKLEFSAGINYAFPQHVVVNNPNA